MVPDRRLSDAGRSRANNFDALRVALALVVIFSHSYPLLQGSNDHEPLSVVTGGLKTNGELAVEGFFLISGFLIAASWDRSRGLGDYLRKRALRIYPGFLVAVLFSSLVAGPLLAAQSSSYWAGFQVRPFLIQAIKLEGAYAPGRGVNGSLWSIRYEFFCYLGLAGMGLVGFFRHRWAVVLAALGCWGLYAAQLYLGLKMPGSRLTWLWGFPDFWPRLASAFLAGTVFYLYANRVILSSRVAAVSLALLAVSLLWPRVFALLIPWVGGYLLFFLAYFPAGRLRDIARRGDLTYGLYLYAFPVQLLLVHWFGPSLSPTGLTMVATAVTAVFAVMSWHLVERPCLLLKGRGRPVSGVVLVEPPVVIESPVS